MEIPEQNKTNLYKVLLGLLIILSLYFVAKFFSEVKSYSTLGNINVSTITLSGHGEVQAVPDIANIYFTISKENKTIKEAQSEVAAIEKKVLDFLKISNINEKDIKTTNASFYPKYEYKRVPCPEFPASSFCPDGKQVLTGYVASESITVKIRNVDDVGKIIQELGSLDVTDSNGPNFAIDDEEELKAEARKKAIDDAKEKAKILAKDLGVRIVKIIDFNEFGNYPVIYGKAAMLEDEEDFTSSPAVVPKGENTISSDVTITYEIR